MLRKYARSRGSNATTREASSCTQKEFTESLSVIHMVDVLARPKKSWVGHQMYPMGPLSNLDIQLAPGNHEEKATSILHQ